MFDVGGQRDERRKWIQCFNDVTAILVRFFSFVANLFFVLIMSFVHIDYFFFCLLSEWVNYFGDYSDKKVDICFNCWMNNFIVELIDSLFSVCLCK